MKINKYLYLILITFFVNSSVYADDANFLPDTITCTRSTIDSCDLKNPYFKIGEDIDIEPGTYYFQGARSDASGITFYIYQTETYSLDVYSEYFSIGGDMKYPGTAWQQDYSDGGFVCKSKTVQACPFNNVPF